MQVAVSYLTSLYSTKETIKKIENSQADFIHVDLMDGGFVPNKNFTIEELALLLNDHKKPLDIHLMTFDPIIYVERLSELKPEFITFHIEATKDIVKTIEEIKKHNVKVGLAISPKTHLFELMPYLSVVDLVLIMSVEPGAGGQSFIENSVTRLEELIKIRKDNNLAFKISMDGGINDETIKMVQGLDLVVSGSFICKSKDYDIAIDKLKIYN